MAVVTKADLDAALSSLLVVNTTGQIEADDVLARLRDLLDSYANIGTVGDGELVMGTAVNGVAASSSIVETSAEVDIGKPCQFLPTVSIGSERLRVLGDLVYQQSAIDDASFAPLGSRFTPAGTSNPMYVQLGAVEQLPAGANQTIDTETLALNAGDVMSFVQPGAAGAQHISRQFVVRTTTTGTVLLEIFSGTDATGPKIVDQEFVLAVGDNTLVFETFPLITPTRSYFIRYTARTAVTLRGLTIGGTFVPYNVTSGWPYSEVRVVTANDGAFIADLLEALSGDDRLDYNALKNLPNIAPSAPSISAFSLQGVAQNVDAPLTISGSRTFDFVVENPGNVQGNLTLSQGATVLSSTVDPNTTSVSVTVTSVTLQAGESVTFTLEGASILTGNPTFQRTYTVTARSLQDFIYISAEADNDPSDVDTVAATAVAFAPSPQTLTIPTFAGNAFLTILQRASDPELTQILIGGLNQLATFTKTDDALTVGGALYDAYVTTNQVVGSALSGQPITLVR